MLPEISPPKALAHQAEHGEDNTLSVSTQDSRKAGGVLENKIINSNKESQGDDTQ